MRDSLRGPQGSSFWFESLETRRLLSGDPPYADALDNDIAYGSDGSLHVAWYDSQAGSLQYASRSASGVWANAVTVDSIPGLPAGTPGVGHHVSLAVDSQNRPAVAYIDSYNADVKFASRDAGGNWVIKPVVETLGSLYPSLAFMTTDTPCISYYVTGNKDLKFARWNGSSWVKSVVDSTDDVGRSSSMVRLPGAVDRFAIAYEKTSAGDFKYAELGTDGLWSIATVDTEPLAGGGFTSLAFDTNNNPAFSYYDSWTSTLKYASRSGSTWTPIAVSGRICYYTNLWFNPADGKGHMVYYDVQGNLIQHLTKPTSGGWTSPNASLYLGGGNRVSAAFKTDGTIAFTYGPPIQETSTPMGVGVQAGSIVAAPTSPSATTVSNTRVDVAWTYPSGLTQSGFKVGVSTDGGRTFPDERVIASASARSAQITGLAGGTAYTFAVRAYNASGDSSFSNVFYATTIVDPPAAPGGLAASAASSSQINLSWNDVAGETGYKIERSLTGTDGWAQIDIVGAGVTAYPNSGLSGNTTYYYRVRAYNAGGDSAYSAVASATTLLATPGNFAAAAQSTSRINLAWSDISGETGYVVQRLDGGSYVDVATLAAGVTGYSAANLAANTSYTFRVHAIGAGANSDYAAPAGATTPQRLVGDPSGTPSAEIHDPGASAGDGFGQAIATKGNLILSGNAGLNGGIGGAVLIDATTGLVVRRFANPAAAPDTTDGFGFAVAFVGNRVAISAPDDDFEATPKVYIYDDYEDDVPDLVLEGTQEGGTGFGRTLAGLGDDLIVQEAFVGGGSEGAVRRYDLGNGVIEQTFLSAHTGDQIGNAMAADAASDTILLTTLTGGGTGTNVIEFDATSGAALREFAFPGAFNLSVAYSANSIFVGDYHADAVYQFDRADTSSNPTPVHTYTGTSGTLFGLGLVVSGDQLLITAPGEQVEIVEDGVTVGIGNGAGHVYDHTTHALVQRIDNPTPDALGYAGAADTFGSTAAVLGGGQFVIGDPTDDANDLLDVGGVYTFDV